MSQKLESSVVQPAGTKSMGRSPAHRDTRDRIAWHYGFATRAELLRISRPCPLQPGETTRSYVARKPDGQWFIWADEIPPQVPGEPLYPTSL